MFAGSQGIRFSELFRDNMDTHGWWFCYKLYVVKGKMPTWEFDVWMTGWALSK